MRKIAVVFAVFAAAGLAVTTSGPVRACGSAERPVVLEVDQVTELRAEASRLDARAFSADASASALDRRADQQSARARELRNVANVSAGDDREATLVRAQELAANAALLHAQASGQRAQAAQLRLGARTLRERATRLAGGRPGGGWGGSPRSASMEHI